MRKIAGVAVLLAIMIGVLSLVSPQFSKIDNIQNNLRHFSLLAIFSIGVGFVIISGGIDLSLGSIIGLSGVLLGLFLVRQNVPPPLGVLAILGLTVIFGFFHGFMVARLNIQPFIVTLCGLLIYRGIARFLTQDQTQGFGISFEKLRSLATGKFLYLPIPFFILLGVMAITWAVLHRSIYGRHLYALGYNEEAARYSGINTRRLKGMTYIVSAFLAGLAGIIYALDWNTIQPATAGVGYELYAIAAAVLGGCSLRGGEGTVIGIVIGAAIIQILNNGSSLLGISDFLRDAIIGMVILLGVTADEIVKGRVGAALRAARAGRKSQGPP